MAENRQTMTKKESGAMQGIAILFMLHHHFFNDLSIYGDGLKFWNADWVVRIAWFGKICVGIFAFVSGYGLCKVFEKREREGFYAMLGKGWVISLRMAVRLLIRYWVALLLFVSIFITMGRRAFDAREFGRNFALLEYTYNGAHWYVGQYLKMLFALPIFDGIFLSARGNADFQKKKRWFYGTLIGVGMIGAVLSTCLPTVRNGIVAFAEWLRPAFFLVFFAGWLIAKFRVFERILGWMTEWKPRIRVMLGGILCAFVFVLRVKMATSAAYATLDFLLVPIFVLGCLLLIRSVKLLGKWFEWQGWYSAWLWLTHLFLYDLTKDWVMKLTRSHLLFFVIEFAICAAAALCIRCAELGIQIMKEKIKGQREKQKQ